MILPLRLCAFAGTVFRGVKDSQSKNFPQRRKKEFGPQIKKSALSYSKN
jgi:hypothetical protein